MSTGTPSSEIATPEEAHGATHEPHEPREPGEPHDQHELPKAYDPKAVEPKWYEHWLEHGVFSPSLAEGDQRPTYVLPIPPPNVTGSLHMGHAMMCAIEDVLVRFHRMSGFNTLWQPGIDHAGIATQTVVERLLAREGTSRHELGREKFLERVWQWKEQSGGRILLQQRKLGVSADWARSKFTMDADYARAVRHAFVRMHEDGLIYRDTKLVHWDCEARTVLSNLEVENEPSQGELVSFAYPVEGGLGEIVVATTRPETMLGDTAVAVHPDDERYKHLHGKFVLHPFVERRIPIITDAILVDPAFGTGAVKVTPAHDFNDFATGKRHGLEELNILTLDGKMNERCGEFAGLDRFEARKAVKRALDQRGLARGTKQHDLVLPRSERNHSIVEPMISTQWFVKTKPLAEPALAAVKSGDTVIVPAEWAKTYEHWMTNILDWCISRQLWWGHRIPAWYCGACGHVCVVDADTLLACTKCGARELEQDADVLDTWFSSGLWPFATLGWPERTPELERFYPASDLETGYDILFFWVARMMMMGIYFTGKPPFKRVLLHGLVVDECGDKMSKVKGNVIDPLDLIGGATFDEVVDKALPGAPRDEALKKFRKAYPSTANMGSGFDAYGSDALRYTLVTYSPQSKRIPLSPKKIEGYRNFCNKIWNATRYALPYVAAVDRASRPEGWSPTPTRLESRWILSRMGAAFEAARLAVADFRLDDAALGLYHFFWGELCDWYLEITKPTLTASSDGADARETREVLAFVLESSMRALHPFLPFLTEEIWQRLPKPAGSPVSVAIASYPTSVFPDPEAERDMAAVQAVISAARSIRAEHEVHPGAELPVIVRTDDVRVREALWSQRAVVQRLAKTLGEPVLEATSPTRPRGHVMHVAAGAEVLVSLVGHVDAQKELARVERETKKVDKDIAGLEKRLAQPAFADKAPPEVVAEAKAQLEALRKHRAGLDEARGIAAELGAST
jgi:valyl-tRNA synthetase